MIVMTYRETTDEDDLEASITYTMLNLEINIIKNIIKWNCGDMRMAYNNFSDENVKKFLEFTASDVDMIIKVFRENGSEI